MPQKGIIQVSADSRYKLYVNGQLAEIGPCKGDRQIWFADKVNLMPYLKKGKKVAVWGLNDRALALYTTFKRMGYQVCLFDDNRRQTDVGGKKIEVYSDDDLKNLCVDVIFTSTYFLFKKTQAHVRKVNEKVKVLNGLEFISHLVSK